jgi:RNAse (barnase) inhibitor barstar
MTKPIFELDGRGFDSLDAFYDEITRVLGLSSWGRNLDAFNDILRGGFGRPDGGFVLRWRHSDHSRAALGYEETVKYLERKLDRCHPTNREHVARDLQAARCGVGQTIFDILVEIIHVHCPGGREAIDGIELELL